MENFRYGIKEIIVTVCGAALFVLVEWLQMSLIAQGRIPVESYEWVQLRVLVVATTAVLSGPVAGVLCGLCGDLLINTIFETVISYPEVVILGVYGLFMGLYFGKYHYPRSRFTARDFVDFNAIQLLAALFCSMFFMPLFRFLIEDVSLYSGVTTGAKSVAGNSIVIGIICPVIMAIEVAIRNAQNGRDKRRRA